MSDKIYGWYDRADQPIDQPTYNPPFDAPCLYCGSALTDSDVRTHSMMAMPDTGPARSYFYRTHRTCDERSKARGQPSMDGVVWDAIKHNGD
jgi:hypothetical protein